MLAPNWVDTASTLSIRRESPTPGRLIRIDAETFRRSFNRMPFLFRHSLADHPLFALPRLVELAKAHQASRVEYNAGDIPVSFLDWKLTPQTGLSPEQTISDIEQCGSWMVLKRTEFDQEYKNLLDLCLDDIAPMSETMEPGMCEREGAIFLSSPWAVTPYHMDHEINFLLQIRGSKTIYVFSASDREVLSERELEDHFSGPAIHRNLFFDQRYQSRARQFELKAGYGIHIPTTDPHWVQNGDGVSISFSTAFKTPASLRRGGIYNINARLRRLGLHPRPVGRSALIDSMKYQMYRGLCRAEQWLGKTHEL